MKVTTDACLFGAWCATKINATNNNFSILDIGAGTGLLSLMLASTIQAKYTAIEIDAQAAAQAKQNFEQCAFGKQIQLVHSPIQQFNSPYKFNFIICNPPFYENSLHSNNAQKNMALHSTQLSLHQLLQAIQNYLLPNAYFALLLPYSRYKECLQLANTFFIKHTAFIKQTPQHNYFRVMLLFSTQPCSTTTEEITIKQNNQYTPNFVNLLQPYYLHL